MIVQLEPNLDEVDAIAIEDSGKARLVRDNTVIYELDCIIPPTIVEGHYRIALQFLLSVAPNATGTFTNAHIVRIGKRDEHEASPSLSVASEVITCYRLSVTARFSTFYPQ